MWEKRDTSSVDKQVGRKGIVGEEEGVIVMRGVMEKGLT